jgi:Icc-related predicted phosphoesterase
MKLVCISDTHGKHQSLQLPDGELLIHAGDVSKRGEKSEILDFLQWFSSQKHLYKIFIAGNHDFYFEKFPQKEILKIIPENVMYLNDSGVNIQGIQFWGSPITPWFFDWAFNRKRGEEISQHWKLIPKDTNVLITHGPVANILDKTIRNQSVGCEDLLREIQNLPFLKLHICGHIHEAYGQVKKGEIDFINASVLDIKYNLVNQPIVIEL